MPLLVEGGRIPPAWAEKKGARASIPIDSFRPAAECIRIALVNNMPDPALADTEIQFFELL